MLWHATHTNWIGYKAGTWLCHLRFPVRYQKIVRDGVPIFWEKKGPTTIDRQPPIVDERERACIREKAEKALKRRYILRTGVNIKSLIRYFAVTKGEDDVRMVYDAKANQLNDAVWVPSFWLPTVESLVRSVDVNTWMMDRDIGDMFLNFQLHYLAMPFTGVDLRPLYEDGAEECFCFWVHNLMGFKPSPYNSVKVALIVEEVCKGDHLVMRAGLGGNKLKPFQWDCVRLNLPGPGYDPTLSWVSKLREDGNITCDLFTYVDDEQILGPSEELCWEASPTLTAKQAYLGIIDAACKFRPGIKTPGAWNGSVVHVLMTLGVCCLTSEEKWDNMKHILKDWHTILAAGDKELSHSKLTSDR